MQHLEAAQSGRQLDRVDLGLFANEAKERLLSLLGVSGHSVPQLLRALGAFSERQAESVAGLQQVGNILTDVC